MSTTATVPPIETTEPAKITFTSEQQEKLDVIIKQAMGRAASDERAKVADLTSRLNEAEQRLSEGPPSEEVETLRKVNATREKELATLRDENIKAKREALVNRHADRFVDTGAVLAMSERNLRWSEERKGFDVVNEDGSAKLNTSTFEPMTINDFFDDFATRRPYMVRSEVKTGNASHESHSSSLPSGRQTIEVEQVFGKKSDSRIANQLARTNINEYRRLKTIAKTRGIIG